MPIAEPRIVEIARTAHEVNRAYCKGLGDDSQPPWEEAPDWQRQSALDGVLSIRDGTTKTPEEQHEQWMQRKLDEGWTYGPKDADAKTHPCLVPFVELPVEQRTKDILFRAVVKGILGIDDGYDTMMSELDDIENRMDILLATNAEAKKEILALRHQCTWIADQLNEERRARLRTDLVLEHLREKALSMRSDPKDPKGREMIAFVSGSTVVETFLSALANAERLADEKMREMDAEKKG